MSGPLPHRVPRKLHGFQACASNTCISAPSEGPSADTDGLFRAPGTYQTGPSTAVSIFHQNRIETAEQLSMQYDALQAEIDASRTGAGTCTMPRSGGP